MSNVEWRATIGYDGYEVSNTGLVRSYWKQCSINGVAVHLKVKEPRMLCVKTGKMSLTKVLGSKREYILVTHLVMAAFGKPPKFVHFKDGDRTNRHVDNLEYSFKRQFIPK